MILHEPSQGATSHSAKPGYPYQRLASTDIRLFTIYAGADDEEIKTSLQRVFIDEEVEYETLSYAWHKSVTKDPSADPDRN